MPESTAGAADKRISLFGSYGGRTRSSAIKLGSYRSFAGRKLGVDSLGIAELVRCSNVAEGTGELLEACPDLQTSTGAAPHYGTRNAYRLK